MSDIFTQDDEDKSSVRVVVRVRPLSENETNNCIAVDSASRRSLQVQTHNAKDKPKLFTFDYVAGPLTTQKEIFDSCGKPIIDSCLTGYNGTIFCYGQTGSGKTFTMGTAFSDNNNLMEDELSTHLPSTAGLIPRVIHYLFSEVEKKRRQSDIKFLISCSFLEIYNERITDLLDNSATLLPPTFGGNNTIKSLSLREDFKNGVYVEDLTHEDILSPMEALSLLKKGAGNRHVGSTSMNNQSSRSHSVFTIYIKSQEVSEGGTKIRTSRLNLIDLAGSERQSSSNAEGERLKEACSINKSLSTLGKVIKDLVDVANGISRHVQYRDSKLTFLLKDSLGGNSKTCVIANVSPAHTSSSETLSTLTFAQRAKRIKNEAKINEETSGSVPALQEQIRILRRQLGEANKRLQEPQTPVQQIFDTNDASTAEYVSELQKQHLFVASQLDEEEEKTSVLTNRVSELKKVISSKEYLLSCTRFLLKLREARISKMSQPNMLTDDSPLPNMLSQSEDGFISGKDFDFDKFNKDLEMDIDTFSLDSEDLFLSKAETLLRKALAPEQHPDVIQLKVENMELKEQLNEYENQFSKELGANKNLFRDLNQYIQSLELSIRHLTNEKDKLTTRVHDLENTHRRNSIVLQDQMTKSEENEKLLGEITRLELVNEEMNETIVTLKKDLSVTKESEQNGWKELEAAKQLLDEIAAEKDEYFRLYKESESQKNDVMQIIDDIEKQQHQQREREEQLIYLEATMKEKQVEHEQQVEELLLKLQNSQNQIAELQSNFDAETRQVLERRDAEILQLKTALSESEIELQNLNANMIAKLDMAEKQISELRLASEDELRKRDGEISYYKSVLVDKEKEIEILSNSSLQVKEDIERTKMISSQYENEMSLLRSQIQDLTSKMDTLTFREEELVLAVSEKDAKIETLLQTEFVLTEQTNELKTNEKILFEALQDKEATLERMREEISLLTEMATTLENQKTSIEETMNKQLEEVIKQLALTEEKQLAYLDGVNQTSEQLEEYKNKLSSKEEEITEMRREYELSISSLREEVQSLKKSLDEHVVQNHDLEEQLKTTVSRSEEERRDLLERESLATMDLQKHQELVEALKMELQTQMDTIREFTTRLSLKEEEIKSLKQEHDSSMKLLRDEIQSLKNGLSDEQVGKTELERQLDAYRIVTEEEKQELVKRETNALHEVERHQELIEALKVELETQLNALESAKEVHEKLVQREEEMRIEHEKQVKEQTQTLKQTLDEQTEQNKELERKISLLESTQQEFKQLLSTKEAELSSMKRNHELQLEMVRNEVETLKTTLTVQVERNDELQKQLTSFGSVSEEEKKEILEREMQQVKKHEELIEALKYELETQLNAFETLQQEHKVAMDKKEEEIASVRVEQDASIKMLREEIQALKKTLNVQVGRNDQLQEQLNSIGSTDDKQELLDALKQVEKYKETIKELEQSQGTKEIQSKYEEVIQKLKETSETNRKSLLSELEQMRVKYSEKTEELLKVKNEIDELRSDNEKLIGHNNHKQKIQYQQKIKQENNDLKDELMQLKKEIQERDATIKKMKAETERKPLFASNLPSTALFNNNINTMTKDFKPTSPTRDRSSVYLKRPPITSSETFSNTLLNLSVKGSKEGKPPQMGRSRAFMVNNLSLKNIESNKENVAEQVKTPQTAPVVSTTTLFNNGNRKRRHNSNNTNPLETSFDTFTTVAEESTTKKVKTTSPVDGDLNSLR